MTKRDLLRQEKGEEEDSSVLIIIRVQHKGITKKDWLQNPVTTLSTEIT